MAGITGNIRLDNRHTGKHLPDTIQTSRLIAKGKAIHVFNDLSTMESVAKAIIEKGEFMGLIRGYKRYGLLFSDPIGYRFEPSNNSKIFLFYGEIKIDADNRYHVIPRTRSSNY
jgi:hypothetical protein